MRYLLNYIQAMVISFSLGLGPIPWVIMSEVCNFHFKFYIYSDSRRICEVVEVRISSSKSFFFLGKIVSRFFRWTLRVSPAAWQHWRIGWHHLRPQWPRIYSWHGVAEVSRSVSVSHMMLIKHIYFLLQCMSRELTTFLDCRQGRSRSTPQWLHLRLLSQCFGFQRPKEELWKRFSSRLDDYLVLFLWFFCLRMYLD